MSLPKKLTCACGLEFYSYAGHRTCERCRMAARVASSRGARCIDCGAGITASAERCRRCAAVRRHAKPPSVRQRNERIKSLAASGVRPRRAIAAAVGATKNAVIGVLDRAGMCDPRGAAPSDPPREFPALASGECRWPLWGNDARPSHEYCGEPAAEGRPYCPTHAARAYQPAKPLPSAA